MKEINWLLIVKRAPKLIALVAALLGPGSVSALELTAQELIVAGNRVTLNIPANTRVDFLAAVPRARFPTFGPDNEMLIGTTGSSVYRLLSPYTRANALVSLSPVSHSTVYRDGELYIAAENGVYVANYDGASATVNQSDFRRILEFPVAGHSSRTIIKGSDGTLYVALGISFNCNDQYLAGTPPQYQPDDQRGGVWRIDESGPDPVLVPYSTGLRNPIGIAFNPIDDSFWTTNAGSDDLGNNLPREIFSRLTSGSWHGMPWFQFINGQFQTQSCISSAPPRPASEATPPSVTFDARSTPQGLAFVTGNSLGSEFNGNALVAIHGSSSSNRPPKVVMVKFSGGNPTSIEDVITGFQYPNGSRFARPSGAIMGSDGHFYFTSDRGSVQGLFRLRRVNSVPPVPGNNDASKMVPAISGLLLDDE